ncbi:MAG: hypothetical protein ACRD3S_14650, partial [Terracidiphilus sp.]
IKNVPAPSDAQFPMKAAQHVASAVAVLELRADAADNLPTMRAHALLLEDAASRLVVELGGLNSR